MRSYHTLVNWSHLTFFCLCVLLFKDTLVNTQCQFIHPELTSTPPRGSRSPLALRDTSQHFSTMLGADFLFVCLFILGYHKV
jgi:hypothetical protein